MPVYEYVCDDCECSFQQQRKVTERQTARCPKCNGTGRKVIGAVGIIFKGSGWHCTDYRKPDDKKTSDSEDKAPAVAAKSD
jgi:putative FmdB family regulatory protein